jgi:hypothetical protein
LPLIPGAKVGEEPLVGASSTSKFEGDGETKRESTITTTVAARVTRVLGGGLMEVVGARETRVNGETQIVLVQGVARDRDIDADNTIKSTIWPSQDRALRDGSWRKTAPRVACEVIDNVGHLKSDLLSRHCASGLWTRVAPRGAACA